MGQQQLLLLVIGIVIVGLAVVVGIQSFNENQRKTNIDNYTAQAVQIAANAVAWKAKPKAAGGGQGAYALTGLTLDALGYSNVVARSCGNGACQEAPTGNGTYVFLWDQNSSYAHMGVSSASFGSDDTLLDVGVFVYGPSQDCFQVRIRTRTTPGAPMRESYTPGTSQGVPATCTNPW